MRTILNNKHVVWLLLSVPAILLVSGWWQGRIDSMDMLHPTGEWSARLMIFAMALSPLLAILGPKRWLNWLVARRRAIGVAAFGYALVHLIFYLIDMGNLDDILAEWLAPGIWTGWAAFALMLPLALTSNDASMRWLRAGWKRLQRLVYPAALLTMLHWFWVHNSYAAALAHFVPLGLLLLARFIKKPFLQMKPQGV
ncbi:MAG: ferric reductase-like transmembrane domain-containing protein [Sphingomonadales bacterium]|jgi:sulfoxide reductase heme-binding subunit YedZ|nr:ferric reductase-like transmembrane domain-containing protein [Sphingomonadales bacterium]MBK9003948.1 ferric reductase-like transmembrane domain-containing protein [Sphingomonadales bacterium]MBK9269123.1 ferric reductase-like transmembrane domain-containing protein [Sphingomonadales bacterium]MBP6433517.1 ferric reductase-like transmembrane domain-containing protein [Sphingorhabdus sp.]